MAITTVTLSKPPGLPGPQYMYEFYPRTENARVTVAAENYEETGPWTAVDAITDGSWSIELPTGTDQGGDLLPWYVVETPLTKVPGRGLKPATIGDFYITPTSTSWPDLIADLIQTTATADPSTTFGTYVTEAQSARDAAQAAAGVWQPSTAYGAGAVAQAPDGSRIKRNASGTSRATFDATEQAAWTAVLATSGTVEQAALAGSYAAPLLPEKFGAAGNGVADDTAAMQAWVDALTTGKALGWLKHGKTYRITAALDLGPQSDGWRIEGNGAHIVQATDNTPIFKFTHENTHTWHIHGIEFEWTNAQAAANTQAVAIGFQSTTSLGYGFYNCSIHRCSIRKGYALAAQLTASSVACPVWGIDFFDIYIHEDVSGTGISLRQDSNGQPNISIRKFYSRHDALTLPAIRIKSCSVLTLANVEFNKATSTELDLDAVNATVIDGIKSEQASLTVNITPLWKFNNSGSVVLTGAYFLTTTFNGSNMWFVEAHGGTRLIVNSLAIASPTLTAGNMFVFAAGGAFPAGYLDIQALTIPAFVNTFYTFDSPLTATRCRRLGNGTGYAGQTIAANGAVTIDASLGNTHAVTLQANATSTTISNGVAGQRLTLTWIQDATGGRTYSWPAACKFAGAAPADTTASKRTSVTFIGDGTNWYETGRAVAVG